MDRMETTVKDAANLRRCMAVGAAVILGVAALLPSPVSAHHAIPAASVSIPSHMGGAPAVELTKNHSEHGPDDSECSSPSENRDNRGVSGCDASRSAQSEHSATAGPGPSAISRSSAVHRSNAAPPEAAPAEPVTIAAAAPNASSSSGAGVAGPATVASSAAAQNPRPAGGSPITRNAPVLVLPLVPMPSQPTVLGPVPLVVPAIGGVAGPAGGALPWVWFVALGAVDLGLAAGILLRRRRRSGGAG
jgi:hypothetical protein